MGALISQVHFVPLVSYDLLPILNPLYWIQYLLWCSHNITLLMKSGTIKIMMSSNKKSTIIIMFT